MCAWRPENEIETQRHDRGRQFLYILTREIVHFLRDGQDQENRGLGAVLSEEF